MINLTGPVNAVLGAAALKTKLNDKILKMNQATKKVEEIKEAKKVQRRNFMKYLGGQTVGSLDPEVQKTIAKGYNKKQRKELMDSIDAQAKGGNK